MKILQRNRFFRRIRYRRRFFFLHFFHFFLLLEMINVGMFLRVLIVITTFLSPLSSSFRQILLIQTPSASFLPPSTLHSINLRVERGTYLIESFSIPLRKTRSSNLNIQIEFPHTIPHQTIESRING